MIIAFQAEFPARAGVYADWCQDNGFIHRELALREIVRSEEARS
jgi:hypothetical protein